MMSAFLFDLDGTLVDSVYQHVLAWREAMHAAGIELAVWRIHRQIGMSGGAMVEGVVWGNRPTLPGGKGGGLPPGAPGGDERERGVPCPLPRAPGGFG